MKRCLSLLIVSLVTSGSALANQDEVEIDTRWRPNMDITAKINTQTLMVMRVLQDRGIVALSKGQLTLKPLIVQMTADQSFRFVSGKAEPDDSFAAEMHFLEDSVHIKRPDGQLQQLSQKLSFSGARVVAVIEANGTVRDESVKVTGIDASLADALRKTLMSTLAQAASPERLKLVRGRSVSKDSGMQVPLPGIGEMNVKTRISHSLTTVENGIARVQLVYDLDFSAPVKGMKMSAEGTGRGSMLYDVRTQMPPSSVSDISMKILFDLPDGLIEVRLNLMLTLNNHLTSTSAR